MVATSASRKRPRNERTTRCCSTQIFLSLVGLSSWSSISFSSTLAFCHHVTPTSTLRDRKSITTRNNKLWWWRLDVTYNNVNDENDIAGDDSAVSVSSVKQQHRHHHQQQQRNLIDTSSCLVVSPHSSSLNSSSRLPPWLELLEEEVKSSTHAAVAAESSKRRIRQEIEWLEHSLLSFRGGHLFSSVDVADIIRAIYWCSDVQNKKNKVSKILGSVAFCRLMLQLEEEVENTDTNIVKNNVIVNNNSKNYSNKNKDNSGNKHYLVTKDILLASILHFSECINARYDGVYEEMQQPLCGASSVTSTDDGRPTEQGGYLSTYLTKRDTSSDKAMVLLKDVNNFSFQQDSVVSAEDVEESFCSLPISLQSSRTTCSSSQEAVINNEALDNIFTIESLHLAKAASRLKRCEILTSVVLSSNSDDGEIHEHNKRRRPVKKEEYAEIRNLMVSLTDDWRALAIRCVASLFRLEGVLKKSNVSGTGQFLRHRNPETTLTAKDSLQLYANLSQQMGLHRLRSQIEAKAFRILYPRQFSASSTLFLEHGGAMTAISDYLSSQLKQLLYDDHSLVFELENLQVLSRVKEPFSFWKKLLKKRFLPTTAVTVNNKGSKDILGTNQIRSKSQPQLQLIRSSTTELSIMDVNDGVALRVILKARKLDEDESDETTRGRERILCYYIQHLLRSQWPETDPARVKDYIRYPKRNGYQCLHHTSKITRNNQDFFFEVQIRSEEMDRQAEFGVAAHSQYKLGSSYPSDSTVSPSETETINSSALVISSNEELINYNISPVGDNDSSAPGPYIYALQKAQQNLVRSHVYVFLAAGSSSSLEAGQILTLSAGSKIMDVIDTLRQEGDFPFDGQDVQVWCNGILALSEENIKNGDMILIQPLIKSAEVPSVNRTSSNALLVS